MASAESVYLAVALEEAMRILIRLGVIADLKLTVLGKQLEALSDVLSPIEAVFVLRCLESVCGADVDSM